MHVKRYFQFPYSSKALIGCVILPIVLFTAGCKKINNSNTVSAISLIHSSPGLGALDFYINDIRIHGARPIYYLDSIPYYSLYEGTYSTSVRRNISTHVYFNRNVDLVGGKLYTLFVTGKADSVKSLLTEDDLSYPENGKAKLRFINLCPDASLDVRINGDEKFMNQAFMTYTSFTGINPAVYSVSFYKSGTTKELVHENLTVEAGKIYTVIAKGLTDSNIDSLALGTKIIIY